MPWWTWIAPAVLLVGARAAMEVAPSWRSPAAVGLDLPLAVGLALVHWWGPRVLAGALLACVLAGLWAAPPWWAGAAASPPLLVALAVSWWAFGRFGRGGSAHRRPWARTLPDLARLLGWGVIVPIAAAEGLRAGLVRLAPAFPASSPLPFEMHALGGLLACLALGIPALLFATEALERRGWTVTRGAMATRLLPAQRAGPRERALLAAVLVGLALVALRVTAVDAWLASALVVILVGSRWGPGAVACVLAWAVAAPLVFADGAASGAGGSLGGGATGLALWQAEGVLAAFGLCGLLLGRTLSDARRELVSRRRSEELARASEARLAEAQRAAGVGCWEWDAATGATWWSDELYRIAGVAPGDLRPGREAFLSLVAPEDRERTRRQIEDGARGGHGYELEHCIVRPDGTRRAVWTRGTVERDAAGRVRRIVGTSLDVTELRAREAERDRFEAALVEARRLESLGVLAGGLAHDFNNLLVGILANADLVEADGGLSPAGRAALERVQGAAERAGELVRRLLQTAGRGAMSVGPVDVATMARGMIELVRPALRPGVDVVEDHAPDLPVLEADGAQLEQVLLNLLLNAAEAIAPADAGTVTVTTRVVHLDADEAARRHPGEPVVVGDYVALSVADDGCGMDAPTLERIFEPFFTTRFDGRGLGLAAVRGIVRRHRGALEVESDLGRGTTMRVLFPVRSSEVAVASADAVADSARADGVVAEEGAGDGAAEEGAEREVAGSPWDAAAGTDPIRTVLLVDDVEAVRAAAEEGLRAAGWHVISVESGAAACEVVDRPPRPLALVLLDWTMPDVSGAQVLAAIRRRDAQLPVVVISGYDEARTDTTVTADPAAWFLHKPFGLDALQRACAAAIAGRERALPTG